MNDYINKLLRKLFPERWEEVAAKIENTLIQAKPSSIDKPDDWYMHTSLYVTYPDMFHKDGASNLSTLTEELNRIRSLGFDAIHVLPFFESPQIDAGFDISSYSRVREDLGGNEAFDHFVDQARSKGMSVFIDLILNHVSYKHDWFQKALGGDKFYRDFFIWKDMKPQVINRYTDDRGMWATYKQTTGETFDARIIFPEQCGEIPHWDQYEDGNWYYHTFYPHQLDLDWLNPNVLLAIIEEIIFWAEKGVSFRLDAIPFLAKDLSHGIIESNELTHDFVKLLHAVVKALSEDTVFLVEAYQGIEKTIKYFGVGEPEAELAYNFELMNGLWIALVTSNDSFIWEALEDTKNLPEWGQWVTFLRNHDELSLEFATPEKRDRIFKELADKGLSFREGFGIAGRTYSLLNEDEHKLIMAYSLLYSLPGAPALIAGDEFGVENNYDHMSYMYEVKQKLKKHSKIDKDTRDINRGPLYDNQQKTERANHIQAKLAEVQLARRKYRAFFTAKPQNGVEDERGVFIGTYQHEDSKLTVICNLTNMEKQVKVNKDCKVVYEFNAEGSSLQPYGVIWALSSE